MNYYKMFFVKRDDMKRWLIVFLSLLFFLPGCIGSNKHTSEDLVQRFTAKGLTEKSIDVTENDRYESVSIRYGNSGYAYIFVYSKPSDAKKYWNNLEDDFDDIQFLDEHSAYGYEKNVYDASIRDWIYYESNIIVKVNMSVSSEWPVYVGDDGEEYFGFGEKVSDVADSYEEKMEEAEQLKQLVIDCLNK